MSSQWGLGDVEIGAKYRFLPADEKDWWPQAAFYPFLDFPTRFGRFLAARDSQIIFSVTHGWSAFGGPTMRSTLSGWEVELAQWLKPFLDRLGTRRGGACARFT